jgi:hypothetical protein
MDLDKKIEILTITAAILASNSDGLSLCPGFPNMTRSLVDNAYELLRAVENKVHQLQRADGQPKSF